MEQNLKTYTYADLKEELSDLCIHYPFVERGSIGKSVMGKDIHYLRLGKGGRKTLYVGAHHSLEWLTAVLLMRFAEDCANAYANKTLLCGRQIVNLFEHASLYIVPMLNPDGVELVAHGIDEKNLHHKALLHNCGEWDFAAVWQANIHGVDLNHNYDAMWQKAQMAEIEAGIYRAGPTRYGGMYAHSEPETEALVNFVTSIECDVALAYHSQGEEIFYDFEGECPTGAYELAAKMAELSGYTLSRPEGIASYGGFKDWFIHKFNRPGYTIEIGRGKNPIGYDQLQDIIEKNYPAMLCAAEW